MVMYLWGAGGGPSSILPDLITNVKLNQNGQPLFKGTAGWEDTLQLGWFTSDGALTFLPNSAPASPVKTLQFKDNPGNLLTYIRSDGLAHISATVPGALTVQPNVDPAANTQVIQVLAAGGATQFYVTATGGLMTRDVASLTSLSTPTINGSVNVQGVLTVPSLVVTGAASIGNIAGTSGIMQPSLIVSPGVTSLAGPLNVAGGVNAGLIVSSGTVSLAGGLNVGNNGIILAGGAASFASVLNVNSGAIIQGNASISNILNTNILNVTNGAIVAGATTSLAGGLVVSNLGLIVSSGTVSLAGGLNVGNNGIILAGGVASFHAGVSIEAGGLLINLGTATFNGLINALNGAIVAGATTSLAGPLNVAGGVNAGLIVSSGTVSLAGGLNVGNNGIILVGGTASVQDINAAAGVIVGGRIVASSCGASIQTLLNFVPMPIPTGINLNGLGDRGTTALTVTNLPSTAVAASFEVRHNFVGIFTLTDGAGNTTLQVGTYASLSGYAGVVAKVTRGATNQVQYLVGSTGGASWSSTVTLLGFWEPA